MCDLTRLVDRVHPADHASPPQTCRCLRPHRISQLLPTVAVSHTSAIHVLLRDAFKVGQSIMVLRQVERLVEEGRHNIVALLLSGAVGVVPIVDILESGSFGIRRFLLCKFQSHGVKTLGN